MTRTRATIGTVALAGVLAASASATALAGTPFSGAPAPRTVVESFRVVERAGTRTSLLSWTAPERFAERRGAGLGGAPLLVERDGVLTRARSRAFSGSVSRRIFAPQPDGSAWGSTGSRRTAPTC